MKRSLLFALALGISIGVMAQKSPSLIKDGIPSMSQATQVYEDVDLTKSPSNVDLIAPQGRGTADITIVNLGTSANAFGLY